MNVSTASISAFKLGVEPTCIVVPIAEDSGPPQSALLTESDTAALAALTQHGVINGKPGNVYFHATSGSPYRGIVCLGIGDGAPERVRRATGAVCDALAKHHIIHAVVDQTVDTLWPAEAVVEGILLGQYRFDRYQAKVDSTPPLVERLTVVAQDGVPLDAVQSRCALAAVQCDSANWARDLACTPSNDLTPTAISREAQQLAERTDLQFAYLDEGRMGELGMNALLGVSKGSAEPAQLIILKYEANRDADTLALVGKGITFDTGGISIKPSAGMDEMKYDMCGAAAVLGAMRVIAAVKPAVNVVCVVPSAENMVGPAAQRPGDIVRAFNGKTIETKNTDAEGRLILADALAYTASEFKPRKMVDAATLTGGCIVALGNYASAVMSNDDNLVAAIQRASDATGERIWRLPLWDDYSEMIKGTHADLSNIGEGRKASSIIGGAFLKEFVGNTPWAHIDIAGTAWDVKNVPYWNPKYATGYGVRLLSEWVRQEAAV